MKRCKHPSRRNTGSGIRRSLATRMQLVTNTFSIVAVDPDRGDVGVAVASKYPAVGSVVPFVRCGLGAFVTQNWGNPRLGAVALGMLERGVSPSVVLGCLLQDDPDAGMRQLAIIDVQGRTANHNPWAATGEDSLWWGSMAGRHYACQGAALVGIQVLTAMASAFETAGGILADRLMAALVAGDTSGGDRRGREAAALVVAGPAYPQRNLELRVDSDPDAVAALAQCHHDLKRAAP